MIEVLHYGRILSKFHVLEVGHLKTSNFYEINLFPQD